MFNVIIIKQWCSTSIDRKRNVPSIDWHVLSRKPIKLKSIIETYRVSFPGVRWWHDPRDWRSYCGLSCTKKMCIDVDGSCRCCQLLFSGLQILTNGHPSTWLSFWFTASFLLLNYWSFIKTLRLISIDWVHLKSICIQFNFFFIHWNELTFI